MSRTARSLIRFGPLGLVGALLLLGGSCGTGGTNGSVSGNIVGGVLPPRPIWYALAPTSDPLVPIAGACEVERIRRALPRSVDLRRDGIIPPVQDQRWNSCVAWTFVYHMLSAIEARRLLESDENKSVDMADPANWFSPDFLYSQRDTLEERLLAAPGEPLCFEPDRGDDGAFELGCMRPEKALRLLMERGACRWPWMCEAVATRSYGTCEPQLIVDGTGALPDALADENIRSRRAWQPSSPGAEWFKPECYVRFGSLDEPGNLPLIELRSWLRDEGTPIGIVVQMRQGWMTYAGENQRDIVARECFPCDIVERRGVCLDATGTDLGSQHMMTIIAYDDDFPSPEQYPGLPPEKRGSFLVMNQFGTKWGHDGMMWIPYAELRKIWIAGYGLVGGEPGRKLRVDGIARTACGVLDDACANAGEACAQDDLDGDWKNLGGDRLADDVPRVLGAGGVPAPNVGVRLLVSGATPLSGDLGDENAGDWFRFEVVDPNTEVEISLSKGGGDPVALKLVDEEQRRLGTSQGDRDGVFESISRVLCDPGTYYVKVFRFGFEPVALYDIGLFLGPAEGNDDVCTATPLALTDAATPPLPTPFNFVGKPGVGGQAVATLNTRDETTNKLDRCDWYAVNLPVGEAVEITLASSPEIGCDMWRGETPETAEYVATGRRPLDEWRHAYASLPPRPGTRLFVRVFLEPEQEQDPTADPTGGQRTEPGVALPYTLEVRTRGTEPSDDRPSGASRLVFAPKPGEPGCWQASVTGAVDEADPIDFHRIVIPPGAIVRASLATPGPLCLSTRTSASKLPFSACREIGVPGGDPVELEFGLEEADSCEDVLLTVTPLATWRRDEVVQGGTYTLTVEVCLGGEPAAEDADAPPTQPVPGRGVFLGWFLADVVGGDDTVDWWQVDPWRADIPFLLRVMDTCADVTVEVRNTATGQALPFETRPAPAGELLRRYRTVTDDPLWIGVRSKTGAVTPYTIWLPELQDDPLARDSTGGDDRPQEARSTLAVGATGTGQVFVQDNLDYWRVPVPGATGSVVPLQVQLTVPPKTEGMRLTVWDGRGRLVKTATSAAGGEVLTIDAQGVAGESLLILVDVGASEDGLSGWGSNDDYQLRVVPAP